LHIKLATEQDNYWLALYDANWNVQHAWIGKDYWLTGDESKIFFGSAKDVVLYRGGVDLLKTDDDFDARSLRIGGVEVIDSSRVLKNVTIVLPNHKHSLVEGDGGQLSFNETYVDDKKLKELLFLLILAFT
jgi:hypothetical protein